MECLKYFAYGKSVDYFFLFAFIKSSCCSRMKIDKKCFPYQFSFLWFQMYKNMKLRFWLCTIPPKTGDWGIVGL